MKESNKLQLILKDSGLEKTKAQILLNNFKNYFDLAAEWELKAKSLIVTDETQLAEMKMARTGRLFLREKRIAIEKTRKTLKEDALREGKMIDNIANIIKAVIIPLEEYLHKQERFIEIKKEGKEEVIRLEVIERMKQEEIKKQKEIAEEQERIRLENIRLKKEAIEKEEQARLEREAQEKKLAEERAKAEEEKRKIEEKARLEREAQEKKLAEERAKAEEEKRKIEEKTRLIRKALEEKAQLESKRQEKKMKEFIKQNEAEKKANEIIKCPYCGKSFSI